MNAPIILQSNSLRQISLTQGYKAIVDEADFEWLSQYEWHVATYKSGLKYAVTHLSKNRKISMHRLIMNAQQGQEVDHWNNNGLDNRRMNLRFSTHSQNCANNTKQKKNASSKYKGVFWHRKAGKWCAQLSAGGKTKHLGLFVDESEAAKAYDQAALIAFGEFAKPNFSSSAVPGDRSL